jgi:hypothetical protein
MAQTNAQIATRYTFTGQVGGLEQEVVQVVANECIVMAKLVEGLYPDGANKTTIMAALDTLLTAAHSQAAMTARGVLAK